MDRRDFLKTTGLIAAIGAAPSLLSSCSSSEAKPIKQSSVPECWNTDVLVVGGGPAGVCAALAAARQGVKVLIAEHGNCLGGMATTGMIAPFMTCFDGEGEQMIIRGIFEEIIDRLVAIGGAIHPSKVRHTTPYTAWITAGHDHVTPFDEESLKYVLDQMVIEAGIKVIYHADFVEPIIKGSAIRGAVLLTQKGLGSVVAKQVIDCTGDATVAYRSGVPCVFGNGEGGVQPSSTFFTMSNVDSKKLEADVQKHLHEFRRVDGVSYRCLHWRVAQAEAVGEWPIPDRKSINIFKRVRNDEWTVNCSRVKNIDATDSESLTEGEIAGRKQVWELMRFFRKYVPGCEDAVLMKSAYTLGIRESRHIQGLETLQADNLLNCVVPEDSIFLASNSVDIHGKGGSNRTQYTPIYGKWYGVPYKTLVPVGIDNLLVAGRCLSATSDAAGAVRVMPPVMAMGQAAGTAAALCVKGGVTPATIDFEALRSELIKGKVFLG
ncbi:MAG: FAD-dependent oxidoreductase [Bacteroidales bacterium]|nr:FAD-dependent oxidoreductase [Bacteroidales bacterium]